MLFRSNLKNLHPCITHFYGLYDDGDSTSVKLVMELSEGLDLQKQLLNKAPTTSIEAMMHKELDKWSTKWRIAKEIAQGMHFLHSNNVLHRDLKTSNVLVRLERDELKFSF